MINERQKPYQTTQEEQDLRWEYGNTDMSLEEFNRRFKELEKQGKIIRSGRVVKSE